ncbi:far upstream element-binding protein 2-like [Alexandromys fortis]|uniref:far upstream element-binding protein 2-like n=1 Tax=Alexandromys fortis TaxID=100897 RepID=UPI002152A526|nr:far upstream element-binding protein 2-like [Microtus fortis]
MAGPGRTLLGREPHAGPRPAWRGGRPPPPPLPTGRPRCELRGLWAPSSGSPRAARNFPALRGGGGPGSRGQRAGGGWSRTSARAGCLVRRFSVGDECQAFHRGGLRSPPETESATGLFNNSPRFYLRGNRLARNRPGNRCTF